MRFRGRVNGLDPNSPRDFFSTDSLARLEWTFIYYWYLTVVMDPEALNFADAPLVELDWKGHTERNQQLFRYGFHWTLSEMVGKTEFQRRPARTGTVWVSQVSPPFVWIRRGFDRKQRAVFEDTVNLNLGTEENARNIPIGPALSPKEKEDLTRCLLDYKEFCAWSYEDMPGLYSDLVEHRLPPETSPSSKSFGGYTLIWTSKLERRFHKKKQQFE